MLFYVSIYSGKTQNCYIEADSKNDIINFYESYSNAKILNIKRIVYSKEYNINFSGAFAPDKFATSKELKVLAKTNNFTNVLSLRFPKTSLTFSQIEKSFKKNILINNESIKDLLSVVRR